MRVSEPYATAVREHCVPHDMRALIGLYKNTRAMDIYVWLSYRLPRIPNHHPLFLRYVDLKPVFGTSIRELRKFRELFRHALRDALAGIATHGSALSQTASASLTAPRRCPLTSPVRRTVERSPAAGVGFAW
jgi:hypothetical protein